MWYATLKALAELPFSVPQKRRMRERATYSKADFLGHFGAEADVASIVWDCLAAEAVVPGFKPHPDDDLVKVFGLADEDLSDVVLDALLKTGARVPPGPETATMPPLRTVTDVVAFVASMKGRQAAGVT